MPAAMPGPTPNPQGGGWTIELEMLILVGAAVVFLLGSGRFALRRDPA